MPTYTKDDYERIANAIDVSTADVLKHEIKFEDAATWYRLRIPPAKREGGPTLELRNQRPKRRCQSKILNTWSGHRTAQIDPEKCRKINGRKIRF